MPGQARSPSFRGSGLRIASAFAIALIVLYAARPRAQDTMLDSDERQYIAISIHHYQQLLHGGQPAGYEGAQAEGGASEWRAGVHATSWGYNIPGFSKVLWGAAFDVAGIHSAPIECFPRYQRDPKVRHATTSQLLPALPIARWVVLVFAAACAAMILEIGRHLAGWPTGLIAYVLWLASPLVYRNAMYIRIDFFQVGFALAALWTAILLRDWIAGRRGHARMIAAGVALGALCGLATASKLNGALTGVAIAAWVLILWWPNRRMPGASFTLGPMATVSAAGATAWLVFFLLDPILWDGVSSGLRDILARWEHCNALMARSHPDPREVADSLPKGVLISLRKTLFTFEPLRAWTGLRFGLLLLPAGLACLALETLRRARWLAASQRAIDSARLTLVHLLIVGVGMTLWLPVAFDRYFLPFQPFLVLLEAIAITAGIQAVRNYFARRADGRQYELFPFRRRRRAAPTPHTEPPIRIPAWGACLP